MLCLSATSMPKVLQIRWALGNEQGCLHGESQICWLWTQDERDTPHLAKTTFFLTKANSYPSLLNLSWLSFALKRCLCPFLPLIILRHWKGFFHLADEMKGASVGSYYGLHQCFSLFSWGENSLLYMFIDLWDLSPTKELFSFYRILFAPSLRSSQEPERSQCPM